MLLKNKIALITGGSRGIGKAIARAFLREGASVMLAARNSDELRAAARDLEQDIRDHSGFDDRIVVCAADVSRFADIQKLVAETIRVFKKIDVLVNAAGTYGPIGPSEKIDFEKWKQAFDTNLFGTFRMMQEVIPVMAKAKQGKIINFSGGGDGPFPRFSAYSASKVAVVRLTETIAEETKGSGIAVNAIAPGPVNTEILAQALAAGEEAVGKEKYAEFLKQKSVGGVPPEKAAELCVFLASAAAEGLTGRFLSAVWDDWKSWTKEDIKQIMSGNRFTLRRMK